MQQPPARGMPCDRPAQALAPTATVSLSEQCSAPAPLQRNKPTPSNRPRPGHCKEARLKMEQGGPRKKKNCELSEPRPRAMMERFAATNYLYLRASRVIASPVTPSSATSTYLWLLASWKRSWAVQREAAGRNVESGPERVLGPPGPHSLYQRKALRDCPPGGS